jgi:hypothetical protein
MDANHADYRPQQLYRPSRQDIRSALNLMTVQELLQDYYKKTYGRDLAVEDRSFRWVTWLWFGWYS